MPALAPQAEIGAINPDLKVPRNWSWSLSVQRELPWGLFGEVGYVGAKGQQLLSYPNINNPTFEQLSANAALPAAQRANTNFLRPYKGFSNIRFRLSDAESNYHALQLFLSRRTGALRWTLSYTLARARDNGSGNGDNFEAFDDAAFNYGPSTSTARMSWWPPGPGSSRSSRSRTASAACWAAGRSAASRDTSRGSRSPSPATRPSGTGGRTSSAGIPTCRSRTASTRRTVPSPG